METSNRGGYRPGAGRKSEWKSGETKAVKLPVALIPRILEIAKVLDAGGNVLEIKYWDEREPVPQDRVSWNCYRRVEEYNQCQRERYWGDWEWRQACQSEAEAKANIAQWEKWNQENNARTDGALIHEEYEIRLERIIPANLQKPQPGDVVLGGCY